ncbi:MAG: methionyl aminopeptidase [Verrucomicrobiota bacterium]|jgi:methionyl aminopeptidase|nr:methionyl aminopeptidase [Verrucomicrobiota bacterium]MDK2962968.1 methionyl aminopeptidase [Verrucomicrobiota bacterium]
MIIIKNSVELAAMRRVNQMTARVRDQLAAMIRPGITTLDLGNAAFELIRSMGGTSAFYGYHGYPGQICVSVNEEVVHGIPGRRVIKDGDIVSIDTGISFEGFVGDTAVTVAAGEIDAERKRLLEVTQAALEAGIAKAIAGNRLGDISHAIQTVVEAAGFSVVREFVGHGIGRDMHEDPQVPNFGKPGRGPKLKPGMTLAIEPMVNIGGPQVEVLDDNWTAVTKDGHPSAHFEHTVAVGIMEPEILTLA